MDSFNDFQFGVTSQPEDEFSQLSFNSAVDEFIPDFGFFGDASTALEMKETGFDEYDNDDLSRKSTSATETHEDVVRASPVFQPSEGSAFHCYEESGKRSFAEAFETDSVSTVEPSTPRKERRVEQGGMEAYVVDGEDVPRLQLGESGRAQLKSSISSVLKMKPELRKQCNSIQKVKNASIIQLLAMARICGIWDQAVKISENFLRKYPCKREVLEPRMVDSRKTDINEPTFL